MDIILLLIFCQAVRLEKMVHYLKDAKHFHKAFLLCMWALFLIHESDGLSDSFHDPPEEVEMIPGWWIKWAGSDSPQRAEKQDQSQRQCLMLMVFDTQMGHQKSDLNYSVMEGDGDKLAWFNHYVLSWLESELNILFFFRRFLF